VKKLEANDFAEFVRITYGFDLIAELTCFFVDKPFKAI
jgi:hypothetical protein